MMDFPKIEGFVFRQQLTQSVRCSLWRAEQTALERDVLVTVFGSEVLNDAQLADALFDIVLVMAQVKSQLIPDVIDVIRTSEQAYVILEDRHAQNIVELLVGRRLNAKQVIRIAMRLAEGFAELHAAHLVYGGLSPKSLYISEDSEPVLPDISPASFEQGYGCNPPPEAAVGSAPYVAPEQYLETGIVGTHTDMFAAGMTLYALATGQVPFGSLPPEKILEMKLVSTIPSPCDISPNFPPALAAVLSKLAQRNPDNRYADWDEVLFDLHQSRQGIAPQISHPEDSVIAPPDPAVRAKAGRTIRLSSSDLRAYRHERARRCRRVSPWLIVGAATMALVALALFATVLWVFLP